MYKKLFLIFFTITLCDFGATIAETSSGHISVILNTEKKEHYQEIMAYSRAYRKNTKLPAETEDLRQKNILERVFACLRKYDDQNSIENAVAQFIKDQFPTVAYDYVIMDASLTNVGGKSSDPVFLINDNSNTLHYVVKAFRNPRHLSSKFLPEISALDYIQQLSMPGVMAIQPLAFASYTTQEGEWGLLLETAATGQRIDQFVNQLGQLSSDSKDRQYFEQICQKAFRRMAESLAELHAKKSSEPSFILEEDLKKYEDKLSKILNTPFIIEELEKRFSKEDFLFYIEKIKVEAQEVPIHYSHWHGDAHLGNMFYDDTQDVLYFIDVAKLHQSLGMNGGPLRDGTIDLIRVEENFRRKSIGLLSEHEVSKLLKTFYEIYEQRSGQKIPKPVYLFHKTHKLLGRLIDYASYHDEEDPIKRSIDQAVFMYALEHFENQARL